MRMRNIAYGKRRDRGQIIVEVIIAIAVIATLAASLTALIAAVQQNLHSAELRDVAASLTTEAFAAVRTVSESDDATSQGYNKVYCPPSGTCPGSGKGTNAHYNALLCSGQWILRRETTCSGSTVGDEAVALSGTTYTRFLTIENVCRDASENITGPTDNNGADAGTGACDTSGGSEDPSTQRITATVRVQGVSDVVSSQYLTRWRTVTSGQSDWSGGAE